MSTIQQLQELRNRSNVSMGDCKKALDATSGNVDEALVLLQKWGILRAADRAGRIATQGKVWVYNHGNGSKVAIVEVNCETDFAANSTEFKEFCDQVAMQVVGMSPLYVSQADIPEDVIERQTEIFAEASRKVGMPPERLAKIVEGKLKKWVSEVCLVEQESCIVPGKTIEQLRIGLVAKCGENVNIRRFVRWEVGEGLAPSSPQSATKVC